MHITTVGLDLAKRVFQVHGVDAAGKTVVRRKLQRSEMSAFFRSLPPCLIGIEASATSHYWARLLGHAGHDVRLIPPAYVKPYVRRSKTDAADAEAICEAVGRPNMRFVPVKSASQQASLLHHRTRDLLVRRSCPNPWCRSSFPERGWLNGQAANAGIPTKGASLNGAMVSSVM